MNPLLQRIGANFWTHNLVPGKKTYGEKTKEIDGNEWREWNPFRSKLAAGLCAGLKELPINAGDSVLYLGSAEGTTVSHVSDLVGSDGLVVGVDISPRAMAMFGKLVDVRPNVVPLLGDANDPASYKKDLDGFTFDVLIQDVAQKNQADIFVKNAKMFGHKGMVGLLVIKSRSVDFSKHPEKVLEGELKTLKPHFSIKEVVNISRFETDHFLVYGVLE